MKRQTMVGIGEILWDEFPGGRTLGGAPANFAYHCCQFGNRGVVVSSVGNDEAGQDIGEELSRKEVEHYLSVTDDHPTGRVSVTMDDDGVPEYIIHENVAWDFLEFTHDKSKLANQADVICYGSLAQRSEVSAKTISQIIEATSAECIRIFDINLRQHYYDSNTIEKLLNYSTVLKLNDEELQVVSQIFGLPEDEDRSVEKITERFTLDLVILTKGGAGSRLYSPEMGNSSHKVDVAEIVDTVGAGDSFTASIATGLCLGMSLSEMHSFASRVAAYVCSRRGATPDMPPMKTFME